MIEMRVTAEGREESQEDKESKVQLVVMRRWRKGGRRDLYVCESMCVCVCMYGWMMSGCEGV